MPPGRDADEGVGIGVLRVVLVEGPAVRLHSGQVVPTELLFHVRLGHREDLAVRADDANVAHAGRLDRVEDGRQELRGGGRAKLVVDDDGDAPLPGEERGERRPVDGRRECPPGSLGGVSDGCGLVGVDRGDEVRGRDLERERVAVLLGLVVGGADRERIHRLVGDHGAVAVAHLPSRGVDASPSRLGVRSRPVKRRSSPPRPLPRLASGGRRPSRKESIIARSG